MPPAVFITPDAGLLRARLTPDVGDYAAEMPVCPAFGRLLGRVFRSAPAKPAPAPAPNQYRLTLDAIFEDGRRREARECERARA